MFGSGYVIDHVVAEHNRRVREDAFRSYVSDMAKCIAEAWGTKVNYRYDELFDPHNDEPEKTGDEVALEVIQKLGLEGKTDGLHDIESVAGA